jgi:hypothetical protein
LHRRVLLFFGVIAVLVGTISATPAAASSGASLPQGQALAKAYLTGQATPTAGPTNLGDTNGPALTDDPALLRAAASLGQGTTPEFPRNSATAPSSSSSTENGDSPEGGAKSVKGLNAHDLFITHGFGVEPPDQGLCANNQFVVEMTNLNIKVFDSNLNAASGPIVLETFFHDPLDGPQPNHHILIQGDPRCIWDAGTGRWYLSQLVVDIVGGTSVFQIAASTTSNPLGSYNLYTVDNTDAGGAPGVPNNQGCPCLGDQPTMGADANALFIDTNEFGIFTNEFNGAVIYAIDKHALAAGAATANTVADFVGLNVATPEWNNTTNCLKPTEGLFCWATIRPAISPANDTRFGGVEYFLSGLDFANVKDHRIAVWAMTGSSTISSNSPNLHLFNKVMNSEPYVFPTHFVAQKAGPIPLGQSGRYGCDVPGSCISIGLPNVPQPEGGIQPNDDQFGSATFADGLVWGGLTTALGDGSRTGIAYFAVKPRLTSSGLGGSSIALQNYLTAPGNSLVYPSIGVTSEGQGLISFTLTGHKYFPTSAYALLDRQGAGKVKVAALGQSPQDGFTEYECRNAVKGGLCQTLGVPYRPRWGDYSAAVAVGDRFVFASEYIQFPNCSLAQFTQGNIDNPNLDHTCGGTRQRPANWGTAVNTLSVGEEGKD